MYVCMYVYYIYGILKYAIIYYIYVHMLSAVGIICVYVRMYVYYIYIIYVHAVGVGIIYVYVCMYVYVLYIYVCRWQ